MRDEGGGVEARVAVIYYSATGNVYRLAKALAEGAEQAGAEVRLRQVEELFSELVVSQHQHWGRHRSETTQVPVATLDDLEWCDGVAFGTPTRFGNVAAQLKQFIDQAGRAVAGGQARGQGRDVVHVGPERSRRSGVHDPGAEQHALPLGHGDRAGRLHGARSVQRRWQSLRRVIREWPQRQRAGRAVRSRSPVTRANGSPATPM